MSRRKAHAEIPRIGRGRAGTLDATRYTDAAFLDREIQQVFRRSWVVAGREQEVQRPGSFTTFSRAGVHVVITRDSAGEIHAFRNTCRHRGSRLVHGPGVSDALKCSVHGWSYGLDGKLSHVPFPDGIDRDSCGNLDLVPVQHERMAGLIWVNLDPTAPPLDDSLSGIARELAPYQLDQMQPIQHRAFRIPVNWKLMLENALDFLHIEQVHGRSVSDHIDSRPELALMGDHSRQNLYIAPYGWRRRLDKKCARGGPYDEKRLSQLFKYTIFPNTMLNVLPYHLTVMCFWPDGPNHTWLHYSFCRRKGARGVELARVLATFLASRFILREDTQMLERCFSGMDTDAVDTHHLHELEAPCAHFHKALDRQMAR